MKTGYLRKIDTITFEKDDLALESIVIDGIFDVQPTQQDRFGVYIFTRTSSDSFFDQLFEFDGNLKDKRVILEFDGKKKKLGIFQVPFRDFKIEIYLFIKDGIIELPRLSVFFNTYTKENTTHQKILHNSVINHRTNKINFFPLKNENQKNDLNKIIFSQTDQTNFKVRIGMMDNLKNPESIFKLRFTNYDNEIKMHLNNLPGKIQYLNNSFVYLFKLTTVEPRLALKLIKKLISKLLCYYQGLPNTEEYLLLKNFFLNSVKFHYSSTNDAILIGLEIKINHLKMNHISKDAFEMIKQIYNNLGLDNLKFSLDLQFMMKDNLFYLLENHSENTLIDKLKKGALLFIDFKLDNRKQFMKDLKSKTFLDPKLGPVLNKLQIQISKILYYFPRDNYRI